MHSLPRLARRPATGQVMYAMHTPATQIGDEMPRIPKPKLVPYVDDRPDLDQKFTPLQAPTSVDFGRKPGDPKEPRKRVVLHMRMSTWERVSRRADRQGLRPTIIVARLLEAYGNREIDLAPHPSGIKVTPHRTTFANPDNPSNR